MTTSVSQEKSGKACKACEGGMEKCSPQEITERMAGLTGWQLTDGTQRIRKDWQFKDFPAGIEFLNKVAKLAEDEGHHPDIHLEGYRHVWIELSTHAIGGLSEKDFDLAAKIDRLPAQLRG